MIASLPMYDLPTLRNATDQWWSAIADALRRRGFTDVPDRIDRVAHRFDHWKNGALLLSQSCGYPFINAFANDLKLVAVPFYDAPGCVGPTYCSFILVREDNPAASLEDLKGARVAVNGEDSQSGYNALREAVSHVANGKAYFSSVTRSGSHPESIRLLIADRVDLCAIDCVTHTLLAEQSPVDLAGTRILASTRHAPNLPYVTGAERSRDEIDAMRHALLDAAEDTRFRDVRTQLRITGFSFLLPSVYRTIASMEEAATARGYPTVV